MLHRTGQYCGTRRIRNSRSRYLRQRRLTFFRNRQNLGDPRRARVIQISIEGLPPPPLRCRRRRHPPPLRRRATTAVVVIVGDPIFRFRRARATSVLAVVLSPTANEETRTREKENEENGSFPPSDAPILTSHRGTAQVHEYVVARISGNLASIHDRGSASSGCWSSLRRHTCTRAHTRENAKRRHSERPDRNQLHSLSKRDSLRTRSGGNRPIQALRRIFLTRAVHPDSHLRISYPRLRRSERHPRVSSLPR